MELIGFNQDGTRIIVSLDEAEVGDILNSCVQEADRTDRLGRKRNDPEMIDQAIHILATGNALDKAWVSGRHQ